MTLTQEQAENLALNCLLFGFAVGVGVVLLIQWIVDKTLAEHGEAPLTKLAKER